MGALYTPTSTFATIDVSAAGATDSWKYGGAAAVANKVYFAPYYQDNVGVLTE